jgi:perosamine synthetase
MIPVSEPWFLEEDAECVAECVRTGWVSSAGKSVDEFEATWAAYCGRRYGVAMSSGMTALQAAVAALDLAPGDEVILPSFTIVSCALAVIYNGGVPVLVDADPRTWCMDVAQIESRISPRTRAVMPVHIYGHPVDMLPLLDIAQRHGLAVIEDAAEAHGAEYSTRGEWRRCGGFGTMSCFSFYANKLIAAGEGGMVVLDDPALAARLRSLRDLCFSPERRFEHTRLGYNFRLTSLQASLALPQIARIGELLRRKRCMARLYRELLAGIPVIEQPSEMPWARSAFWMYGIVLSESARIDAAGLAARLRDEGIETRPFFLGMHEQPAFHNRGLFLGERHPVTERLSRRGLYLPSGLGTTEEQFRRVSEALHRALA